MAEGRVLDRVPSPVHIGLRTFNVDSVIDALMPRSYTWGSTVLLDQGSAGYCVGFGWAAEAAARPVVVRGVNNEYAINVFKLARSKYDDRPLDSDDTNDGTTVLAGAKAAQEKSQLGEYRWATNIRDAMTALTYTGPVVFGIPWMTGMMRADANGFIHATGVDEGGHCILARGYNVGKNRTLLQQSWGDDWGGTSYGPGTCFIDTDELGELLSRDGECCVPMKRLMPLS